MDDFTARFEILDGLVVSATTLGNVLKVRLIDVDRLPIESFDLTL